MDIITLFSLAVGLAMDAFAVSICKGLAQEKLSVKHMVTAGLWFGGFQALMPTLGYFLGSQFRDKITAVDHWIAFILLGFIGVNMITGRLKASWASASKPEPVVVSAGKGKSFVQRGRCMVLVGNKDRKFRIADFIDFSFIAQKPSAIFIQVSPVTEQEELFLAGYFLCFVNGIPIIQRPTACLVFI